jgi:hypothetical protein
VKAAARAARLRAEIDAVLADSAILSSGAEPKSKTGISNGPWFAPLGTSTAACG